MISERGVPLGGNRPAAAARQTPPAPTAPRPPRPAPFPPSSIAPGVWTGGFLLQERRNDELSRDVFGNMADRGEDYLESLLIDAFKGNGFKKIDELFKEMKVKLPQRYSETLFNQLDKALRKELDKNEFKNVSLLLKCIQLYLKSDLGKQKSLLMEQGLVVKMIFNSFFFFFNFYLVSWFERARAFVTIIDPNENKFLVLMLEDFFDSALVICKCSYEGKKEVVNSFLPELGCLVTESNLCSALHLEALRTLNTILAAVPWELKRMFPLSEDICLLTQDLVATVLEVGDYDLQVGLLEAVCRFLPRRWRDDLVHLLFDDNYLAEAFKEIKDQEFDTDCRKFLNLLNGRLGDKKKRVYTFPCISAFAGGKEVMKPLDKNLEEFWIDFNTGSQSVTFYVDCDTGKLWVSVRLSKENVKSYSVTEKDRQKIVKISLKRSAPLYNRAALKFKLVFSAEFEILGALRKVLGDEKLMIVKSEDEIVHSGKETMQSETETPVPSNSQRRKHPSDSGNAETQKDNLTSPHRQQLTGIEGQKQIKFQGKTIVSLLSSGKKSKTPSSGMKAKPSEKPPEEEEPMDGQIPKILQFSRLPKDTTSKKKNEKRAEGRKDLYDFESSNSSSHKKVSKAKGKILAQKDSSKSQRTYETRSKSKALNSLERKQSSYRKHLFSESNNEYTSPGQSETSWIPNSQIQATPKSDYTRKKPRVRSKLKVLPLSSSSSDSDYEPEKRKSRERAQKKTQRKESASSSKRDDLPILNLSDEVLSDDAAGSPVLLDMPARNPSTDVEKATQKILGASGKLSREEENSKEKDSDILSGTVTKKPKLSSLEENHLPSEINHTPKKISESVEDELEMEKGQEMVNSVDDAFFSKIFHEDSSDSEVIFALERFIDQLKKYFWSRYKRIEISAQDVLRSSEKSLSAQLYQIHKCRLDKFETLRKTVVEELANLERETQMLAAMEKDALDFWNVQLLKLNTFFSQQKERTESVDSALGETAKGFASAVQNTMVCVVQKQLPMDGGLSSGLTDWCQK
ncbi:synaptonemal complex protein 2-like [Taeniopygia guttata]|uniref:synaptonemal complex protein 2-like n=1 Tax=Taeniopygia guttata TaxID=59729 RepID=UPI003BB88AFC